MKEHSLHLPQLASLCLQQRRKTDHSLDCTAFGTLSKPLDTTTELLDMSRGGKIGPIRAKSEKAINF